MRCTYTSVDAALCIPLLRLIQVRYTPRQCHCPGIPIAISSYINKPYAWTEHTFLFPFQSQSLSNYGIQSIVLISNCPTKHSCHATCHYVHWPIQIILHDLFAGLLGLCANLPRCRNRTCSTIEQEAVRNLWTLSNCCQDGLDEV